jgi:hypothetical protein
MRTSRIVLAACLTGCLVGTALIAGVASWRSAFPTCPGPTNAEAAALVSRLAHLRSIHVVEDSHTDFDMRLQPSWAYHEDNFGREWISRDGTTYTRDITDSRWISYPTARTDESGRDMYDDHIDPRADLLWLRMCGAQVEASGRERHLHGFEPGSALPPAKGRPLDVWVGPDGCPARGLGSLRLNEVRSPQVVDYVYSLCDRISPIDPPPAAERRGPLVKTSGEVGQRLALDGSAVTATSATRAASVAGPDSLVIELRFENVSGVPLQYGVDPTPDKIGGCGWGDNCAVKPADRIFVPDPDRVHGRVLAPGQTMTIRVATAKLGSFAVHVSVGRDEATIDI